MEQIISSPITKNKYFRKMLSPFIKFEYVCSADGELQLGKGCAKRDLSLPKIATKKTKG
jgi:hypothetical protein